MIRLIFLFLFFIALGAGFINAYSNFYFINEKLFAQLADFLPDLPNVDEMKGIYLTANTALGKNIDSIIKLANATEINTLIIDIKDDSQSYLNDSMKKLVRRLRFAGIFPAARLPVFQHSGLAKAYPEFSLKTASGALWKDSGGRFWVDPASKEIWKIILEEAREAAKMGFGEINLDYIRFPSDGRLESAIYPVWDKKTSRTEVINDFSRYIRDNLKQEFPDLLITADVFGYILLRDNDLGIGQSVTEMAEIFDFICPMVYPSHYDAGNFNFQNPAAHPYEVVFQSLELGKKIFKKHQKSFSNIRPWIQDFNMGAIYTPEMVRLQMQAVTDSGLKHGWLIWNPNNKYRQAIFLP